MLSLVFPTILYNMVEAFTRILAKRLEPTTIQVIENFKAETITVMVLFMIVFLVTIFLISLFLSHRIAGPVYRIQSALDRWSRGNIEKDVKLRRFDHFPELADAYNQAAAQVVGVKTQVQSAADKLQELSESLDVKHKTQVQDIASELKCVFQKR